MGQGPITLFGILCQRHCFKSTTGFILPQEWWLTCAVYCSSGVACSALADLGLLCWLSADFWSLSSLWLWFWSSALWSVCLELYSAWTFAGYLLKLYTAGVWSAYWDGVDEAFCWLLFCSVGPLIWCITCSRYLLAAMFALLSTSGFLLVVFEAT